MPKVNKIDSNVSGLRYAEEASPKVLPGTPIWLPLEPNSYNDFGGEVTTLARNPINDGRQKKKGVVTDLDASGGFNTDLTQINLRDMLQGFFFADRRDKGVQVVTAVDIDTVNADEYEVASTTGFIVNNLIKGFGFNNVENNDLNVITAVIANTSVEVVTGQLVTETPPADAYIQVVGIQSVVGNLEIDATGTLPKLVSAAGINFTTMGLVVGEWVFIGGDGASLGFFETENNGFKRISAIAATYLEFDKSAAVMTTDDGTINGAGGAGNTIQIFFGDVIKNEVGALIQRRSYQLERTLGVPDTDEPLEIQSEYLTGSIPNEVTFNVNTADKLTMDLSFVSMDHEQRSGLIGVKTGTRPVLVEADAFNTSSDFSRIKLSVINPVSETPDPLFAFITELTLSVNNNVSPNKAISVLGAFDATAGTFEVTGSMTAYFSDVAAVAAVRQNSDVTLDMIIVKANAGIVVDIPLMALGDGRANVEQDQPITIPLSYDAATGVKNNAEINHTLLIQFFSYLPAIAG